jgi:hypothetical protein
VLETYPEIRDRIYTLARKHNLRVDWIESGRRERTVVPVRYAEQDQLSRLAYDLAGVFGEGWMK